MKVKKWMASMLILLAAAFIVCAGTDVRAASTGSVKISAEQDYSFAQKILKEVNKRRTKKGLKKLKMTKDLTAAAMTRAMEIMVYNPSGKHHRRPNGKDVDSLNKKIDRESTQVYAGGHADDPSTAEEVVDAWISQTGILEKSYRTVGIGVAYSGLNEYFVLLFSESSSGKKESSKKVQTVTKSIRAKTKYLSKKFYHLSAGGSYAVDGIGCSVTFQGKYTASEAIPLQLTQFAWSSSNESAASVSKKGVVKFKKDGTVTITAKQKASPKVKLTLKLKGEKQEDGNWKISKVS